MQIYRTKSLLTRLFMYSKCDGSHLARMINDLTNFNDYKQYGQLVSRAVGLSVSDGPRLLKCITQGASFSNGMDYNDVGNCVGQMASQILDAQF